MRVILLSMAILSVQAMSAVEFDPIIVSSKLESESSEVITSHSTVESDFIENVGSQRLTDLLKNIPGIEFNQQGTSGGSATVFIRGSESSHTLVMIDGVKVYDPTGPSRSFNFANLNSNDIERIEVLKGSQSVLYGSEAIGGVINIITEKGSPKQAVTVKTGIVNEISISNTIFTDSGIIAVNAYQQQSDNISQAKNGDESDLSDNQGITVNGNFEFNKLKTSTLVKLNRDFSEIDGTLSGVAEDATGYYAKSIEQLFKQGLKYGNKKSKFITDISHHKIDRKTISNYGVMEATGSTSTIDLRYFTKNSKRSYTVGAQNLYETYKTKTITEKNSGSFDVYAMGNWFREDRVFEFGSRVTNHKKFGYHQVGQIGVKQNFSKHSVYINYKTGFLAPSIFQITDTTYGNEDLSPEESRSIELGYIFSGQGKFESVLFYNKVDNMITGHPSTLVYQNSGKNLYRGIELSYTVQNFGVSSTLIDYSFSSGEDVVGRPKASFGAFYKYVVNDHSNLYANWKWKGARFDYSGNELLAYDVFDLDYNRHFNKYDLSVSVKNLFDKDYEVARGYSVYRRGIQIGASYKY